MPPPPAGPPRKSQIQPQRGREPFSGAEETILKQFLDEFRKKNKEQRKDLLGYKIYRLIKAAGLQLTAEEWRQRKKKVKDWYYNHGRRQHINRYRYHKAISWKYVVANVKQQEVYAKITHLASGAPPGSKAFLAMYQKGLRCIVDELSPTEKKEYQEMAKEWAEECPPPDVQRKLWKRHGATMLREMNRVKRYQLGLMSWGLETYFDEKGQARYIWNDHSDEFGLPHGAEKFEVMFKDQVVEVSKAWVTYCKHIKGLTDNVPGKTAWVVVGRPKKKTTLSLEGDLPLLPPPPVNGFKNSETLQSMIREFITIHYQLACGKETATPWTSLAANQSILWSPTMWPAGVMVRDPSKIVLKDCQQIVQLWRARQAEGGAKETFRFNFYPVSQGVKPAVYNLVGGSTPSPTVQSITPRGVAPPAVQQNISIHIPSDLPVTPMASTTGACPSSTPTVEQTPTDGFTSTDGSSDVRQLRGAIPTPAITPPSRTNGGNLAEIPLQTPALTPEPPITVGNNPSLVGNSDMESDPTTTARRKNQDQGLVPTGSDNEFESDPSSDEDRDRSHGMHARLEKALRAQSPTQPPEESGDELPPGHDDLPPRLGRKKTRARLSKKKVKTVKKGSRIQNNDSENEDESLPIVPLDDVAGKGTKGQRQRRPTDKALTVGATAGDTNPAPLLQKRKLAETIVPNGQPRRHRPTEATIVPTVAGPKPRPRPIKQRAEGSGHNTDPNGQNEQEQRDEEDALFTVNRRSGRPPKPKYNIAPPAQLRLEKEREKRLQ